MKILRPEALLALWFALCLPCSNAQAVLGESAGSIATTADAMLATRHEIGSASGLTVHRLLSGTGADGLEIREYVAESTGQVVGVAWTGMREPKRIDALLGRLFSEYVNELKRDRQSRNSARLRLRSPATTTRSAHLVIERFARMGFSRARVYLTELPAGVSANDLR